MIGGPKLPKLIKFSPDRLIAPQDLLSLFAVSQFTRRDGWFQTLLLPIGFVSRWAADKPAFQNKEIGMASTPA